MNKLAPTLTPVFAALVLGACSTSPTMPENAWKIAPVQTVRHGGMNAAPGYFALGRYNESRGANEQAVAAYRSALDTDPEHAAAWNALGALQVRLGRVEDGLQALTRAIDHSPEASHLHNNLGYALLLAGRHEAAVASLRRAVELDGNNRRAWSNLATTYRHLGLQDQAEFAAARASGNGSGAPRASAAPAPRRNAALPLAPGAGAPSQPLLAAADSAAAGALPPVTVGTIGAEQLDAATPLPALAPALATAPLAAAPATGIEVQTAAPALAPARAAGTPAAGTAPRAILVKIAENVFELRNAPVSRETAVVEAAAIITAAARPSALARTAEPVAVRAANPSVADGLPPAAAPLPSASRPARYEISNGHGGEGLARRLAGLLGQQGVARPRLTNSRPFDQAVSFVEYRDGYREAATAFAARLPFRPTIRATASNDLAVDVRLMLGRDLTRSDACAVLGLCTRIARSPAVQVAEVRTAAASGE
ncbi:LytR C-terminal domain-containing protein [Aromatoleum bremense]|uniref:Tetratricopeptide repeat protein n=1 Tax=Aromatoleum bremense TaxID=76115 RepID=A0ABX1NTC5_9RHOO|nr:LytR C-terminal domain-containing protein [Aromatoleum bremense]NMG15041.1 tetratricopeptide repeat protein [Aromatoleum bremense]QTQ32251.1 TPR-containing protein [Aromatoleum bremense]